jgi:hypothetical protein
MEQHWYKLYSTCNYTEAGIIQGMLEENQIPVRVMNKLDSSYLLFGEIEVYVPAHLKDLAQSLLDKSILN